MQKERQQLLLITSYNGVYQEDYKILASFPGSPPPAPFSFFVGVRGEPGNEANKIPIHSLWHAVEVLPQPSYVTSSCKSAICNVYSLRIARADRRWNWIQTLIGPKKSPL